MNNYIEQITNRKEENNAVAFFVYKAKHCNQMAIHREGLVKQGFIERKEGYMQAARKAKKRLA